MTERNLFTVPRLEASFLARVGSVYPTFFCAPSGMHPYAILLQEKGLSVIDGTLIHVYIT